MEKNPIETLIDKYRSINYKIGNGEIPKEEISAILAYQKDSEFKAYLNAICKASVREAGRGNKAYTSLLEDTGIAIDQANRVLRNTFILELSERARRKTNIEIIPGIVTLLEGIVMATEGLEEAALRD